MREFNTFGPVYPDLHYHVDRQTVRAAMRGKVERGRYFTLNAGRQTGKTTICRELVAELEADPNYLGLLLDVEDYIADQYNLPYFTPDEAADLLNQHTADTGQPFSPDTIEGSVRETEGQPFLVNRLGPLLTQEVVPDRSQPSSLSE